MDGDDKLARARSFLVGGLVGASAALATARRRRDVERRRRHRHAGGGGWGAGPPPPSGPRRAWPRSKAPRVIASCSRMRPSGRIGSLESPMPIYEYRCPEGHTFERFQSMTAPAPEKCDVCG